MKNHFLVKFFIVTLLLGLAGVAGAAETQRIVVLEADRAIIDAVDMQLRDMDGDFAVDAENGHVTLIGVVKNKTTMDRIVDSIRSVPGVESVDNQLRVDPSYATMNSIYQYPYKPDRVYAPSEIEANIRYNLRPYADVVVSMEDGVAVLSGYVPTDADKMRAARMASRVSGVNAVRNELSVRP